MIKNMWFKEKALDEDDKVIHVGDTVKAIIDMQYGFQGDLRDRIDAGDKLVIDKIEGNLLFFEGIPDHYGGFESHMFQIVKRKRKTKKKSRKKRKR